MGNGASVSIPPNAVNSMKYALIRSGNQAVQMYHTARRVYNVVDQRFIQKVTKAVEKQILKRIDRVIDKIEVKSKYLFVKSISTTTVADTFSIEVRDVQVIQIEKRKYEIYNCGPEIMNIPSLHKIEQVLEIRDPKVIEFLLEKCLWTVWYPSAAWRMKVDQIFNLTIVTRIRNDGILTKETRHLKLCLGRKWIGPHHSNQNEAEHIRKWLHRTDYETDDKIHTAYSEFFHTIDKAWQVYLEKLSQILNQEEFEKKIDKKIDFDPKQVERYPYLRIKYLLHTNVERILKEDRTFFRFAHEFEQWLMEKEDKDGAKIDEFCGSLYDAPIESLREYFENEHMKQEDSKALFF